MSSAAGHLASRLHGANPEKLYAAMGLPLPDRVIDFSTNANVLPCPRLPEMDLSRCLAEYPDDEALELRALVAEREGCSVDAVLFTNGSNEAFYLLSSLFAGGTAAVLQPAYGEYRRALEAYGVTTSDLFDLREADGEAFDLVFICNPCNPTGAYIPFEELERRVRENPRTLFAVDQAYSDFLLPDGERTAFDFRSFPNLLILRSLTKLHHLCGARIGYVLASPEWIARLKRRQPTWSVNAIAQRAALSLMQDASYAARTRAFYAAETPRFMESVARSGFRVRPSRVHFFLIEVDDDTRVVRELLKRGLAVRHTRTFPGLDGRCIRVATRLPGENDLLAQALSALVNS